MANIDITRLKTSWTKFDAVQVITIFGSDEVAPSLGNYSEIDHPVLKSYFGVKDISDPIPSYWTEVSTKFSMHRRLFALFAGIFTHHENISAFANQYSDQNMGGTFKMGEGSKHQTNLRSALIEGGAALNSFRRKDEVPYEFNKIFESESIGKYFKELLIERLTRIGCSSKDLDDRFLEICYELDFHKALSLNKTQFRNWTDGKAIGKVHEIDYDLKTLKVYQQMPAIKIGQWLDEWNGVNFELPMRKKPEPHFYLFKIDVRLLKRISDVHRRSTNKRRAEETNVQRAHNEERSSEIMHFTKVGFPLSTIPERDRSAPENQGLRMPGFLPTAILANILGPGQARGNSKINNSDLVTIGQESGNPVINIPSRAFEDNWTPELKPLEIIDGQHRLWSFDEGAQIAGTFEVPVVAYYDLDRAWQAYLFYVINIKPKKINTSLGYDLYPLLRTQDWLENTKDGLLVYRETRAQELVEALWFYEESPWNRKINMLGQGDTGNISQNAFVRALTTSFLRKSSRRREIGGLFGDLLYNKNSEELKWVRAQQAAFLILLWDTIVKALKKVSKGELEWVDILRDENVQLSMFDKERELDKAFVSKNSNLSRDQGVTGVSMFANDFFYLLANESELNFNELEWTREIDEKKIDSDSIDIALTEFLNSKIFYYIQCFAQELVRFDWRTSSALFRDENQRELQKKYKGSGGYREIRNDLVKVFSTSNNPQILKYTTRLSQIYQS